MMQNNIVLRPHVVLENSRNGCQAIKLTEIPFSGIIISYGKVSFDETDGDNCKLNFEYEVHDDNGIEYDTDELVTYLGEFLQEMIIVGIQNNDLTYTGGVDENRTGDTVEPDPK